MPCVFRYFFDVINTLQGVWVFIIFVCKATVMKNIKKSVGLGVSSTATGKRQRVTSQFTSGPSQVIMFIDFDTHTHITIID